MVSMTGRVCLSILAFRDVFPVWSFGLFRWFLSLILFPVDLLVLYARLRVILGNALFLS